MTRTSSPRWCEVVKSFHVLLTTLLHVRANEVLGILFQDLVDFVQKIVELGLQLVALAGRLDGVVLDDLLRPLWCCLLLLLSLCHYGCCCLPYESHPAINSAGREHPAHHV